MKTYVVGAPMERLAVDIMGPFPKTNKGHKYIMVVADYFSKWVDAFPIRNQEAATVADILVKRVVCYFGVPRILHSDQGSNFESNIFQEMCKILGIDKTRTTAMRPQSDGMVERANRTIIGMLSSFVNDNQKDWDTFIPFLLMAYRSSKHASTGISPNRMMFAKEVSLPIDLMFGTADDSREFTNEYAEKLEEQEIIK